MLGQELERADPLAARIPLTGELDPRLLWVLDRVCQAPAIHLTLAALAADCGASVRTLNRLFLQQLGCSFRQWREQVVLGRRASCNTGGSRWPRSPIGSATRIPVPCPAPSSALPGANRRPEGASSAFLLAMAVSAGCRQSAP